MTSTLFDIPQLMTHRTGSSAVIVARSDAISFAWEEFALKISVALGTVPEGFADSTWLFASPADANTVAVVAVKSESAALTFRFLFVNRGVYDVLGDPFLIAERFPVNTTLRGSLPLLVWPDEPPPLRRLEDLQSSLKTGDSPFLLGAAQCLLDGVAIRLQRPQPERLQPLWQLLPAATRRDRYPAEYWFGDAGRFDISVQPAVATKLPANHLSEEQVKDYPEGRYEVALQVAIETGDQADVNRLLARRTSRDIARQYGLLLLIVLLVMVVLQFLR